MLSPQPCAPIRERFVNIDTKNFSQITELLQQQNSIMSRPRSSSAPSCLELDRLPFHPTFRFRKRSEVDTTAVEDIIFDKLADEVIEAEGRLIPNDMASVPVEGGLGFLDLPEEIRYKIYCMVLKTEWALKPVKHCSKAVVQAERKALAQCLAYTRISERLWGAIQDRLLTRVEQRLSGNFWPEWMWDVLDDYEPPDRVDTELFRVSKFIREESMRCFWLNNTFAVHAKLQPTPTQRRKDQCVFDDHNPWFTYYQFLQDGFDHEIAWLLELNLSLEKLHLSEETSFLMQNARHIAIVAPLQYLPAIVDALEVMARRDLLSISFHPYSRIVKGRNPETALKQALSPLRLGDLVRMDVSGIKFDCRDKTEEVQKVQKSLAASMDGRLVETPLWKPWQVFGAPAGPLRNRRAAF